MLKGKTLAHFAINISTSCSNQLAVLFLPTAVSLSLSLLLGSCCLLLSLLLFRAFHLGFCGISFSETLVIREYSQFFVVKLLKQFLKSKTHSLASSFIPYSASSNPSYFPTSCCCCFLAVAYFFFFYFLVSFLSSSLIWKCSLLKHFAQFLFFFCFALPSSASSALYLHTHTHTHKLLVGEILLVELFIVFLRCWHPQFEQFKCSEKLVLLVL